MLNPAVRQTLSNFFEKLATQSYTIFPLELVLNASDIAQLISFGERNITDKEHQICVLGYGPQALVGKRELSIAQKVTRNIFRELKQSNTDEQFELESFILRTSKNEVPPAHDPHIDEGTYFTVILPLNSGGPGLYLSTTRPERLKKIYVPRGSAVVISGGVRSRCKPSIPATVHWAPKRKFVSRTIAIIVFKIL